MTTDQKIHRLIVERQVHDVRSNLDDLMKLPFGALVAHRDDFHHALTDLQFICSFLEVKTELQAAE